MINLKRIFLVLIALYWIIPPSLVLGESVLECLHRKKNALAQPKEEKRRVECTTKPTNCTTGETDTCTALGCINAEPGRTILDSTVSVVAESGSNSIFGPETKQTPDGRAYTTCMTVAAWSKPAPCTDGSSTTGSTSVDLIAHTHKFFTEQELTQLTIDCTKETRGSR